MGAETFKEGRDKPIAVLDFFKLSRAVTLQDCFEFMISNEFFTRADLEAPLMAMQDDTRVRSKKVRRVVAVVVRFKSAGV